MAQIDQDEIADTTFQYNSINPLGDNAPDTKTIHLIQTKFRIFL